MVHGWHANPGLRSALGDHVNAPAGQTEHRPQAVGVLKEMRTIIVSSPPRRSNHGFAPKGSKHITNIQERNAGHVLYLETPREGQGPAGGLRGSG
jgi:hypothetical protein